MKKKNYLKSLVQDLDFILLNEKLENNIKGGMDNTDNCECITLENNCMCKGNNCDCPPKYLNNCTCGTTLGNKMYVDNCNCYATQPFTPVVTESPTIPAENSVRSYWPGMI